MSESQEQTATSGAAPSLGERIQSAFAEAVDLPTLVRAAFIADLRERDATVADEVESLLRFHSRGGEGAAIADAPTTALPASLVGSTIGGCRLERVLGSGGMSIVYAATQDFPRRSVAVKIVRRERLGESARRRLRVEAEALARLEHPNIARVYAAGSERIGSRKSGPDDTAAMDAAVRPPEHPTATDDSALESPYIAMELVENAVSLTKWADAARLDARARIAAVATIADAIEHAHRAGVVHRDLKPGNVVVGSDGSPKIIDFGIAAVADATVTLATDGPMGTLAYMSPEQARGGAVDTRSDIWGLGALLYDLLTGTPPFDTRDASLAQHLELLLNDPPEPVARGSLARYGAEFVASIPPATDDVLRKALATDAERRYRSASEFADELRRLERGEPLLARPDSEWQALRRVMRRHRTALAASCGVLAAVILALVVSLVLLSHARAAQARADWSSYVASINAASAMLERGDASAAADMLGRAPAHLRGWEWRHLAPRCDQSTLTVTFAEKQQVYAAGWSTDSSTVLAAASRVAAAIDAKTGRERWRRVLSERPDGTNQPFWRVEALGDGRSVFLRLVDSLVLLDSNGAVVAEIRDESLTDLAVDRARKRIFTPSADGFVERSAEDLSESQRVTVSPPLRSVPRAIAVSPLADVVYLGDMSGVLTAIDTSTGSTRWSWTTPADSRGASEEIRGLGVSPDGARIATCGAQHLAVLDAATGAVVWHESISGRSYRCPRFSADGLEITATTWAESVDRHDASDGRRLGSITGAFSQVWSAVPSPDGKSIAAGSLSARVQVFPANASESVPMIPLDGSRITSVDAGDRVLATTSSGLLFEVDRGTRAARPIDIGGRHANAVRLILVRQQPGTRREGRPQRESVGLLVAHRRGVARFDLDASGAWSSSAWDMALEQEPVHVRSLQGGALAAVTCINPGIEGPGEATTILLDGRTGETLAMVPLRGRDARPASETGDDDLLFVPGGQLGITRRLRLSTGEVAEARPMPEFPIVAELSPDRSRLAIGSVMSAGEVAFLDPRTLEVRELLPNHRGNVRALSWTRDSARLATLAGDDTVRLWHTTRAAEMLTVWRGNATDLAFDDDDALWVACGDGHLRVFPASRPTDRLPSR